jgi:ABC-type polysaccharide/polyol phosphate transport system ATPase subunit
MQNIIEIQNAVVDYLTPNGVFSIKDFFVSFKMPYRSTTILKNINLQIEKGETLAVFGKNGSGKSTLLRLISKIIKPKSGQVKINGTVAPIMAISAGIELELTGMENIDLMLGLMGKNRTQQVIDSIAAFSELPIAILNQPIKTYSTGMVARLSFAISFLSDAEIFVIDEVLAVGDLGFQRKCIEHIHSLKEKNKTIIFVSHSPEEMKSICEKGILMENGEIVASGSSAEMAADYIKLFN